MFIIVLSKVLYLLLLLTKSSLLQPVLDNTIADYSVVLETVVENFFCNSNSTLWLVLTKSRTDLARLHDILQENCFVPILILNLLQSKFKPHVPAKTEDLYPVAVSQNSEFSVTVILDEVHKPMFLFQVVKLIEDLIGGSGRNKFIVIANEIYFQELYYMKKILKYLIIVSKLNENSWRYFSVCWYCNNGEIQLVQFRGFPEVYQLFPDWTINYPPLELWSSIPIELEYVSDYVRQYVGAKYVRTCTNKSYYLQKQHYFHLISVTSLETYRKAMIGSTGVVDIQKLGFLTAFPQIKYFQAFRNPLTIFRPTVWMSVLSSLLFLICFLKFFLRKSSAPYLIVEYICRPLLQYDIRVAKNKTNILLVIWSFIVINLYTIITAKISEIAITPENAWFPQTLEDVVNAKYNIITFVHSSSLEFTLNPIFNPVHATVLRQAELADGLDVGKCLQQVVQLKPTICIVTEENALVNQNIYNFIQGHEVISYHRIKDATDILIAFDSVRWPHFEKLCKAASAIFVGSLYAGRHRTFHSLIMIKELFKYRKIYLTQSEYLISCQAIRMEELRLAFFILSFMHVICFIIFVIENK